jgi:hypothetical protein
MPALGHIRPVGSRFKYRITRRCCRTIFPLRSKISAERGVGNRRVTFMKYVFLYFILCFFCSSSFGENLGYSGFNKEGETVEETLARLIKDKSFSVYDHDGWTIASSNEGVMYSFTPSSHPAYPAYVKRDVIERNGAIYIDMSVRCGASKKVCDDLVRSFQELNKKIMQSMGG